MAENWEKINAVQRMQDYIVSHYQEEITLRDLAAAAAYSPWHALRAFSELMGKTPFEYLRSVRLSKAAKELRDTGKSVLDIALESAFGSHEGFTKAFSREFAITPRSYREQAPPIPLFSYYPIRDYYRLFDEGGTETMSSAIVFTQVIERPQRRLVLKRGVKATEYFSYCEEVGCDVWGILESVKGALYESIGVWLPEGMRKPGTSEYCQAVEMPPDFCGALPAGFDMMDLPACKYMVFHGEPFSDESFAQAIDIVWDAIKRYDPKRYGWDWAPDDGPRFQLAPIGDRGYIEALPIRAYKG
ncbi:MAG: AraC family transcriptional regulator [Candidatus Pelethousia sp.]|nr:AraC family transcriptional regulator [Candidatus Pelethousia sp.]